MEKIKGRYNIPDCEHWGDVQNSIDFIRELGCEVIEHFWDGHDCGDAWVDFYCTPSFILKAYKRTSFSFDCDITKYVNFREEAIKALKNRYTIIDAEEYENVRNELISNVGEGFIRQIPVELIFKMSSYGECNTPLTRISWFTYHIGNKVKINSIKIEDDTYSVLLTCDFDDVIGVVDFIKSQYWSCKEDLVSVKPIHNIYKFGNVLDDINKYITFKNLVYNIAYEDNKLRFVNADGEVIEVDACVFIKGNKLIDFYFQNYKLDTENPVVTEDYDNWD